MPAAAPPSGDSGGYVGTGRTPRRPRHGRGVRRSAQTRRRATGAVASGRCRSARADVWRIFAQPAQGDKGRGIRADAGLDHGKATRALVTAINSSTSSAHGAACCWLPCSPSRRSSPRATRPPVRTTMTRTRRRPLMRRAGTRSRRGEHFGAWISGSRPNDRFRRETFSFAWGWPSLWQSRRARTERVASTPPPSRRLES